MMSNFWEDGNNPSNTYDLSTRVNEMDWDADIPVGFEMAVVKAYQKGRQDATDDIEADIIDIPEEKETTE